MQISPGVEFRRNGYLGRFNIGLLGSAFAETIVVAQDGKISNLEESDAKSLTLKNAEISGDSEGIFKY